MLGAWLVLAVVASSSDWECEYAGDQWSEAGLEPPCVVLAKPTKDERAASAKQAWSLSDEQAACVADLLLTVEAEDAGRRDGPARTNGPPEGWNRCVQKWPGTFALWVGFVHSRYEPVDVSALAGVENGVDLARRLLDVRSAPGEGLARVILEQQPGRLVEVLEHPHVLGQDAFAIALPIIDTAKTRTPPLTPKEWQALGFAVLRSTLAGGWLELAVEVWHALPEKTRAALKARPLTTVSTTFDGKHLKVHEGGDLRGMLALALLAGGFKDEARSIPSPTLDRKADPRLVKHDTVKALLDFHLRKAKRDPWEAMIDVSTAGLPVEAYALALPWLAPYEDSIAGRVEWALKQEKEGERVQQSVKARVDAAHRRALARLREAWAKVKPPATAGVDAGVEVVALPEASWPFVERTTPWKGAAPVTLKAEGVPRGLWPVREEKAGKRTVVLALSHRVDPTGEVSMGGYWLLVSKEGGGWQELYLGFADHRPYHADKTSKVPLLDDKDVLRLDVQEAAIDEKSIRFPPIATRAPVTREHVVLEAKLADVAKDTDGDGLTDLLEARLLLDPASRDTDGDGFSDRDDATPRLDDRLPSTALAQVYNAFFEGFSEKRQPPPLVVAPNAQATPEAAIGTFTPMDLEQMRFLVAPAGALNGLKPLSYVVTLTDAELDAATKKFGAFYPMDLEVRVSKDGKHGFVQWSEGWRGGTVRLDQGADGRWTMTDLGSWIS